MPIFFNLALLRAVGARERDHPAVEGWRTPNSASRRARKRSRKIFASFQARYGDLAALAAA
jgi:hypothetical protein